MAISRHDPEWQRTVFLAMAVGVHLQNIGYVNYRTNRWLMKPWRATLPSGAQLHGQSKYAAAKLALEALTR